MQEIWFDAVSDCPRTTHGAKLVPTRIEWSGMRSMLDDWYGHTDDEQINTLNDSIVSKIECNRLKRNASPIIPTAMRQRIMIRGCNECKRCGSILDLTLDHIIPVSKGGETTDSNLQVLCRSCNSRKGTKIL